MGRIGGLLVAATMAGLLATPTAASLRFLVDEDLLLAGDWDFSEFGQTEGFHPETFRLLPFDPDFPSDSGSIFGRNDTILAGLTIAFDGVFTPFAGFELSIWGDPDTPDIFALGGFVSPVSTGRYTNSRAGPDTPVAFYVAAAPNPFERFRGRFCFAAPGGVEGTLSAESCNAVIDEAIAAIPVSPTLPLAATALAVFGFCHRRERSRA